MTLVCLIRDLVRLRPRSCTDMTVGAECINIPWSLDDEVICYPTTVTFLSKLPQNLLTQGEECNWLAAPNKSLLRRFQSLEKLNGGGKPALKWALKCP